MKKKITLLDLALAAGCSESQASRAINGKPNVAPEIRARVLKKARELNYRNCARSHIPNIAFLTHGVFGEFSSRMLTALLEESLEYGFRSQIIDRRNIGIINEFFFDGVIALADANSIARYWDSTESLPLVVINGYGAGNICSIDPDPLDGNMQMLSHLVQLGHHRIARLRSFPDNLSKRARHRGGEEFLIAAQKLGLGDDVENIEFSDTQPLEDVIRQSYERGFSAMLVIHQHLAVKAAECIRRIRLKVPDDISLITYEVHNVSEHLFPPHTTLDFDYPELARTALKQLELRIKGKTPPGGSSILIPSRLIIRGSTAAYVLKS